MTKSFAAQIRHEATNNPDFKVYPDRIIAHKDGTVELRKTFFYTHGNTSIMWMQGVVDGCEACGIKVEVVEAHEIWNVWPKDSYFTVTVKES